MKVYVDDTNRIRAVGSTKDPNLREVIIKDDDEMNPFNGWSEARICTYTIVLNEEGRIADLNCCVKTSSLPYIDEIGHIADDNADKAEAFDIMIGGAE